MYCMFCGKEILDTAIFCRYCGKRQDMELDENTASDLEIIAEKKEEKTELVSEEESELNDAPEEEVAEEKEEPEIQMSYDEVALLARRYTWGLDMEEDREKALELCNKLIEMEPENGIGYFRLGQFYNSIKDYDKSLEMYEKSYELGHIEALSYVASHYLFDRGEDKDEEKGWKIMEEAAEKGSGNAAWYLGDAYYYGDRGYEKDADKAFFWFKKSAEANDVSGWCQLGECYQYGVGCEIDLSKAVECYEKGKDVLNSEAVWRLSVVYLSPDNGYTDIQKGLEYRDYAIRLGNGKAIKDKAEDLLNGQHLEIDYVKSEEYMKQSAEMGYLKPMAELAKQYCVGDKYPKDLDAAEYWAKKAAEDKEFSGIVFLYENYSDSTKEDFNIDKALELMNYATDKNCGEAFYDKAMVYLAGVHIEKNVEKAIELLNKSAELEYVGGYTQLGNLYCEGTEVERDIATAVSWYEKAAAIGGIRAYERLSEIYSNEGLAEKDPEKYLYYLNEGVDANSLFCMNLLAREYYNGSTYLEADNEKAFELWKEAAEKGHILSMRFVGMAYLDGDGVEQSTDKAIEYLSMATANGDIHSEFVLGMTFDLGKGVDVDYNLAFKYFMNAAENGHAEAMAKVGAYYLLGRSVDKNIQMGIKWVKNAYKRGAANSEGLLVASLIQDLTEENFNLLLELANKGNVDAQYEVAEAYMYGKGDVDENNEEAHKWYKIAASGGHLISQGVIANIDLIFSEDMADVQLGLEYLENTARAGNKTSVDMLVEIYAKGFAGAKVPLDKEKAMAYLNEFAAKGMVHAQYKLALIYDGLLEGMDPYVNKIKAMYWYSVVSESNLLDYAAEAMINMSISYSQGDGVAVNHDESYKLLNKAMVAGSAQAKYMLAVKHYNGQDVPQNTSLAKDYLGELAKGDDELYAAKATHYLASIFVDEGNYPEAIGCLELALMSPELQGEERKYAEDLLNTLKNEEPKRNKGRFSSLWS